MQPDTIIYMIINAIRIGLAIHLLSIFLQKKFHLIFYWGIGLIIWGINSYSYVALNNNWLNLTSNLVGLCIIAYIGYRGRFVNILAVLLLDMALGIAIENVTLLLFKDQDSQLYLHANIMSVFVFIIVVICIDRTVSARNAYEPSIGSSILLIAISIGLFIVGYVITYDTGNFLTELSLCVLMIINLLILILYDKLRISSAIQRENELYRLQSDMYKNQLEVLKQSEDSNRILRHDMTHHVIMLKDYISAGNLDKVTDYLESMTSSISRDIDQIDTGNDTVNSIVNYFSNQMAAAGGKISTDIILHDNMMISDFDLNTLLSNLLSNVCEASASVEDPQASIYMRYNRGILSIKISNKYNGTLKNENGKYITTKPHSEGHGIGLLSVNKIIEKYNGYMEFSTDDNIFSVSIIIHV